jgi:hypothetical protein
MGVMLSSSPVARFTVKRRDKCPFLLYGRAEFGRIALTQQQIRSREYAPVFGPGMTVNALSALVERSGGSKEQEE